MSLEVTSKDRIFAARACRLPTAVRVALVKKRLTLNLLAAETGVSVSLISRMFLREARGYAHRRHIAARLGLTLRQAFGDSRVSPTKSCRYSEVIRDALRARKINGRMIAETIGVSPSLVSCVLSGGVRDRTRREQVAACLGVDPAAIWPDYNTGRPAKGGNVHKPGIHQANLLGALSVIDDWATAKQAGLAAGLSDENARRHLKRLVAAGLVDRQAAPRRGYLYKVIDPENFLRGDSHERHMNGQNVTAPGQEKP